MASTGRETRFSVQTKVLIPVLAFLVLVPAIMVWIVNSQINGQVLADARRALSTADGVFEQSLKIRSRELVLRFRNRPTEPHFVAYAQAISAGAATGKTSLNTVQVTLNEWLDEFGEECEAVVLVPVPPSAPIGAHHETAFRMDDFAQAVKGLAGQALNGEPQTGVISLNGAAFEVVSVPVLLPDNSKPIGAFIVALRIGDSAVQQLKTLTHTEILLVAGGRPILSTRPEISQDVLRQIRVSSPGVSPASAEPQPVVVNGEHFLALEGAYGPASSASGVRYVMLSSYEQSLLSLEGTQRMLEEVSIAGFLLSAVLVWVCIRRVIRPLSELRDTAEAVGRGDFSRRITRFPNDECGDLADAFNRMTSNLQGSRAELEKTVETLKNTQAQLIQSEKLSAVGQFVAGVAHELNNPLTAVIGFSDLLSKTATDESLRPHLELIAKSAHRCHKIVQNLLSFARQHPPERVLTQVNGTIDEVLEIMAYDLRTSNIEVVREFQVVLPSIMADPHQLQQVFVNIVGNARQAIQTFRPDGRITVRTRVEGACVRVEFADNGPGIRPENLSRIFDPFFTTKAVGKGTGLGLSLTYGIIQEHRGRISVQSDMGKGATFVIELPIARDGARPPAEKPGAAARLAPARAPSGKTVLVVDDEEWILALARQLIARGGHNVVAVQGAEQAIDALLRRKFDIVVCDWKMPGMSGIQFYEHLLATDPAMAARVLFMSGDVINEAFQEFLSRHKKTCLAKPFAIEDFQGAVDAVLAS